MRQIGFNADQTIPVQKTPWQRTYRQDATILGKNTYLPIDFQHAMNDNTLVIGTSGTGKTYSFVEPNVLQANCNYVIADAKGDILHDVGSSLREQGYHLQILNLVDLKHSMTYNPLAYLDSELDVVSFTNQLLKTEANGQVITDSHQDPFWDKAASSLLQAVIFFVRENLPKNLQNMATVIRFFNLINQRPDQINQVLASLGDDSGGYSFSDFGGSDDQRTLGNYVFEWLRQNDPDSTALKMWDEVTSLAIADKTWSSVVGIASSSLTAYSLKTVENLTASNQINFKQLLQPKNALFIMYDDANNSKNFLSNLFYSQLIHFLYQAAFTCDDKKLPVKVRFFLDDFKNIKIPGFDDYLATARSRNISFCMMLQDESQLEAKFGVATPSVIGDCSAYLLTGTTDLRMAETAEHRFGIPARQIRLMDSSHFLVDISGYQLQLERYDFHDHPHYNGRQLNINSEFLTPYNQTDLTPLCDLLKYLPHERCDSDRDAVMSLF